MFLSILNKLRHLFSFLAVVVFFLGSFQLTHAQTEFGIKAGVNLSSFGDLRLRATGGPLVSFTRNAESRVGYHFGVYARIKLLKFYLRPELVLSRASSEYDNEGSSLRFNAFKADLVGLTGVKLIGPLSVFAGPSLQIILDDELETTSGNFNSREITDNATIGIQVGAALRFTRFTAELRLEKGLFNISKALYEGNNIVGDNITDLVDVDSDPTQLIFSLSYKLFP